MQTTQIQTATNAEVFENIQTGDKLLWDGIKQPVTVTAGYDEGMEDIEQYENINTPTILVEGPRGGGKMLNQNEENRDAIRISTFSMSDNGEWIKNLRIVGWD